MSDILYEGRLYFIEFPTADTSVITAALSNAGLTRFVSWHQRNPIATLRIFNRVGLVKIFGRVLDIRSPKLLEDTSGERQFTQIIEDLTSLTRHITFDNSSGPGSLRSHHPDALTPSLLERFNYFRQVSFGVGKRRGLKQLVEQVFSNPHTRLVNEHVRDHIWNARKPSRKTLSSLFGPNQLFCTLPNGHPLTANRPGLRIGDTNKSLFPLLALRIRGSLATDTPENRFVKHLLVDIEQVCLSVYRQRLVTGALLEQCGELLQLCRSLLGQDFFKEIGPLDTLPTSSPTLTRKPGYRDLYNIFVRSRVGAKHLFDDLLDESLYIELKDIALLYEYWTFYKVADALLGPEVLWNSRGAIVKDGRIVNSAEVTDGKITIAFNKTYGRKPDGSYSRSLRPDIVVSIHKADGSITKLIFDAKYKSDDISESSDDDVEDEIGLSLKVVKSADLHKMHCYVDAIAGIEAAIVVYPGTQFIFYPRNRAVPKLTSTQHAFEVSGIGALPLLPGQLNSEFIELLATVKKSDSAD